MWVWARVHKIDRVRPLPEGGAIVLIEDERTRASMERVPGLSTTIAITRVIGARRMLAARYGGKGEVRYAANAALPSFLFDAVVRAGGAVSDGKGERVLCPPAPASVSAVVDAAFSELAHSMRGNTGAADMIGALRRIIADRKQAPYDRDRDAQRYWPAVFEVAALAGELSRPRGGRWIETADTPVPFAIRLGDSTAIATPAKLAQQVVQGEDVEMPLS